MWASTAAGAFALSENSLYTVEAFTEYFQHLKPGGMIAMIVPESILGSDQLRPLRNWLMENAQLLAVVALPQKVFTGVGANARTGILFARRFTAAEQRRIDRMPSAAPFPRLPPEWRKRLVLITNPNPDRAGWNLTEYLADTLTRARSLAGNAATKE